jgi:hypothetical protein
MLLRSACVACCVLLLSSSLHAQKHTIVTPKNYYQYMVSEDSVKRDAALSYVMGHKGEVDPHTLLMSAILLFHKGFTDSSHFVFWLADVRTRYLVSLYKQVSQTALYSSLRSLYLENAFPDDEHKGKADYSRLGDAMSWDESNPLDASQFLQRPSDTTVYKPKAEWPEIYQKVRQAYHKAIPEK